MLEQVEEYRYISSSVGELSHLSIGHLSLRIATFHKVHKRLTAPTNGTPGTPPKLGRRLR